MEIDGRRDFRDSTKKDIQRNRDTFQNDIFLPYQARFHSVFSLVFHAMNLSSKHLMFSTKIHINMHFFIGVLNTSHNTAASKKLATTKFFFS